MFHFKSTKWRLLLALCVIAALTGCSGRQSTAAVTSTAGWEYQMEQPLEDNPAKGYGETLWGKAPGESEFQAVFQSDIGASNMEFTLSERYVYLLYDTTLYVMDADGGNRDTLYKKCGGTLCLHDGFLYTTEGVKVSAGGTYPYLIRISLETGKAEESGIPVRTFSVTENGTLEIQTDQNRTTFASGEYQIDDLTWKS